MPSFLEILQRRAEIMRTLRLKSSRTRWDIRVGYVYLIYFGVGSFYKVGISKDVMQRFYEVGGTQMPFLMVVEHTIQTDDMYVLEGSFHEYFADKRVRGEWFILNQDDIDLIKSFQGLHIYSDIPVEEKGLPSPSHPMWSLPKPKLSSKPPLPIPPKKPLL